MRIVGGSLGGRRFAAPTGIPARPTTDLAREGLFNILINMIELENIEALDLFAGTGAVSYELLSRSAASVVLVEQDGPSLNFIKKTAALFGIQDRLQLVRGDVMKYLKSTSQRFGLIFADPPYALPGMDVLCEMMLNCLKPGGLAVLEHDGRNSFEEHPHFLRVRSYGDTSFSFFTAGPKTV